MPTTYVKALVNMLPSQIQLTNREDPSSRTVVARPMSVASCYMPIPWCTSLADFNYGKHLVLEYDDPRIADPALRHLIVNIYQQTVSGDDRVRLTMLGPPRPGHGFPADYPTEGFNQGPGGARALASDRDGAPFVVYGDTDAVLVVDERFWVICYRIGSR